jgi:hypothetical protein
MMSMTLPSIEARSSAMLLIARGRGTRPPKAVSNGSFDHLGENVREGGEA